MSAYDTVIGLEVHCELKTQTKCFCSCKNEFGAEPNTNCCPVCLGMPGALPVLNQKAVEYAMRAGLALNCEISNVSVFERKNYFYPDLAKAYQISQLEKPLNVGGYVDIEVNGNKKRIRLNRIHLEEDAGKLIHGEMGGSLVDYNRGGVPLIEIVSEPDIASAEEAVAFLENLRNILVYTGISDCKMQEGSLRCDVNVSVKKVGESRLGTRTEMKNLNSFKAVFRAINYERDRQIKVLEEGGKILQETLRWDDNKGKSISMRTKEDSNDYRYFPDPDLIPIYVSKEYIDEVKSSIPMLPEARVNKYVKELGLPEYDAKQMVSDVVVCNFFESCFKMLPKAKLISNFIMTEIMRKLKETEGDTVINVTSENFTKLLSAIDKGEISNNAAKTVFEEMWKDNEDAEKIIERLGLKQMNNDDELAQLVENAIASFPQSVADYKAGNTKSIGFLVGQVMKTSGGKANPQKVNAMLTQMLNK